MDRLAAHVIATAALTLTLATVPVLFADASHAASATAHPQQVTQNADDSATALLPALPPLSGEAQTQTAPSAAPGAAEAAPPAFGPAALPRHHRAYRARGLLGGSLLLPNIPCADARQVGPTVYEHYRGMIAFSVHQYYSPACHAFYGYSFAWLQFRRLHVRYDVGMAVYDTTHGAIDGPRSYLGGAGGPGYWSEPVPAAAGTCTQGEGHYFYYPADAPGGFLEDDVMTPKVCA